MRILFTTHAASGHFHPLVPLAQALKAAGHEVAFASAEPLRKQVIQAGFRFFAAGMDIAAAAGQAMNRSGVGGFSLEEITAPDRSDYVFRNLFAGKMPEVSVPAILELQQRWKTELIVRDKTDFGGCIAAEVLDIPHAVLEVGASLPVPALREKAGPSLAALRAKFGLGADPEMKMPYRYLFFSLLPPALQGPKEELPDTTHPLRPELFDRSGDEALPAWAETLGQSGRPVVYATLGTVFNKVPGVFAKLLDALREEPIELVLTVGRDVDPAALGPLPEHFHVERYIPQTLILPRCQAVLTHGGFNTTLSALGHGLPLLMIPVAADQPLNAANCVRAGVAKSLDLRSLGAETLRPALRAVLGEPSYRARAEAIRAEIQAMPPLADGVRLLERLATEKKPLRGAAS